MPSDQTPIDLELVAQALATPTSPSFYELEPTAARAVLDDLRAAPMGALPVAEEWINAPACADGGRVRLVKPSHATGTLPVLVQMPSAGWVYLHGSGWVLGNRLSAVAQCRVGGLADC